jgi:hypothetical protein
MPILQVMIIIVVVGVLLWLVNRFIPMQATIKWILNIAVPVILVLWLLNVVGFWGYLGHLGNVPRLHGN